MSEPLSVQDLARQLAVLEERMKTNQAEYESALERLRADMANHKVWLFALVFGAVVTGITLGLALSS